MILPSVGGGAGNGTIGFLFDVNAEVVPPLDVLVYLSVCTPRWPACRGLGLQAVVQRTHRHMEGQGLI